MKFQHSHSHELRRIAYTRLKRTGIRRKVGAPRKKENDQRCKARRARAESHRQVAQAEKMLQTGDTDQGFSKAFAVAETKIGRAAFPKVGEMVAELKVNEAVVKGAENLIREVGKSHKRSIVRLISAHIKKEDLSTFCARIGLSQNYVTNAKYSVQAEADLFTQQYKHHTIRQVISPEETSLVKSFFMDNTDVRSGAIRETRFIARSFIDMRMLFYTQYPRYLLKLKQQYPQLLDNLRKRNQVTYTRFESSFMRVIESLGHLLEPEDGLRSLEEARRIAFKTEYEGRLTAQRLRGEGYTLIQVKAYANSSSTVVPEPACQVDIPTPVSDKTFWKVIKNAGIRWTLDYNPTECPIHDNGVASTAKLEEATSKYSVVMDKLTANRDKISNCIRDGMEETCESLKELRVTERDLVEQWKDAQSRQRQLREVVAKYQIHLKQYEACRSTVITLEETIGAGDAVLYRDFVSQYNCEGKKIANLVRYTRDY